ncbi:MAG: hypothetical protein V1928_01615 [Parcubacteria group bacterium]
MKETMQQEPVIYDQWFRNYNKSKRKAVIQSLKNALGAFDAIPYGAFGVNLDKEGLAKLIAQLEKI